MSDDIAIKLDHVSKTFRLPHEKQSSIKGTLVNLAKGGRQSFEAQQVLNDISFEIRKGEFFGIVGRNGSGKSTLLKMLAGIYRPTQGQIQIEGKLTPFIELGVGFSPELTGRENVFLNGALLGFNRKEMESMYDDIVAFAELDKFMDQKLKNYSSGMQVRLAFSIAIRAESDILLIDEVLAVGDAAFQQKCLDIFRQLKAAKRTIVFVTHDMGSVERFCDRAIFIDQGDLLKDGKPHEIATMYNARNAEASTKGSPTINGKQDRWGSGEVTIQSIDVKVSNEKASEGCDLKVTVRIRRDSAHNHTPVICGLAFYNEDMVNMAGPNTEQEAVSAGASVYTYAASKVPFAPGRYTVTAALYEKGELPFDYWDGAARFKIRNELEVHGAVHLNENWTAN